MQWNKRHPKLGDQRYKVKFAWWPRKVGSGTIVWFERYISVQIFQEVFSYSGNGMTCTYKENRWVECHHYSFSSSTADEQASEDIGNIFDNYFKR